MTSKQKTAHHETGDPKPLRVGRRVRCTDDGVRLLINRESSR